MGIIDTLLFSPANKYDKPLKYVTIFMACICLGCPVMLFVVGTGFRWYPVNSTSTKYEIMLSVVLVVQGDLEPEPSRSKEAIAEKQTLLCADGGSSADIQASS